MTIGFGDVDVTDICVNFTQTRVEDYSHPFRFISQVSTSSFVHCSLYVDKVVSGREYDNFEMLQWADGILLCFDRTSSVVVDLVSEFVAKVVRVQASRVPVVLVGVMNNDEPDAENVGKLATETGAEYFELNPATDEQLMYAYPFGFTINKISEKRAKDSLHQKKAVELWKPFDPTPPRSLDQAFDDILSYEVQYLNELTVSVQAIRNALLGSEIKEGTIADLFGNMPQILDFHRSCLSCIDHFLGTPIDLREVLSALGNPIGHGTVRHAEGRIVTQEAKRKNDRIIVHLVASLCSSCDLYKSYVVNYFRKARKAYKTVKTNKTFKQVIEMLKESGVMTSNSFKQLLLLPCYRLKYLFEQLSMIQYVLPWSPEKLIVRVALSTVRQTLCDKAHEVPHLAYKNAATEFKSVFSQAKDLGGEARTAAIYEHMQHIINTPANPLSWVVRSHLLHLSTSVLSIVKEHSTIDRDGTKDAIFGVIVRHGQEILNLFVKYFKSHKEFHGALIAAVKELSMNALYDILYPIFVRKNAANDAILRRKINEFSTAIPPHFSIKEEYYLTEASDNTISSVPFHAAIEAMKEVSRRRTPKGKCAALLDTSQSLNATQICADDLLPIYAYVVVKSKNPNPFSDCEYVTYFLSDNEAMSKEGYIITTFQSALAYLKEHTLQLLVSEGETFQSSVERGKQAEQKKSEGEAQEKKMNPIKKTLSKLFGK